MKVVLLILLNAVCFLCFAQRQLDYGEVKGNAKDPTGTQYPNNICKSAYPLEISITRARVLLGRYENVTLNFDGWKWNAIKVKGDWINGKTDTVALSPVMKYDTLFAALKSNNIFLLEDQDLLKLKGIVDDGTEYSLSYKAGDHCRSYTFHNPEVYKEMNKNVEALTNYIKIAQLLFEGLREVNAANTGFTKYRPKDSG